MSVRFGFQGDIKTILIFFPLDNQPFNFKNDLQSGAGIRLGNRSAPTSRTHVCIFDLILLPLF